MKPYDTSKNYELPPLNNEPDDIPVVIDDMDLQTKTPESEQYLPLSDVPVDEITDMENNKVEPTLRTSLCEATNVTELQIKGLQLTELRIGCGDSPPEPDYKAAKRREHISSYQPTVKRSSQHDVLDKMYESKEGECELIKKGKADAITFTMIFIACSVLYLMIRFRPEEFMLLMIECILCIAMVLGNGTAKRYLAIACFVNPIMSVIIVLGGFDPLYEMMGRFFSENYIPDTVQKAAYLIGGAGSIVFAVILLCSKSIGAYCEMPENTFTSFELLIKSIKNTIDEKLSSICAVIVERFMKRK